MGQFVEFVHRNQDGFGRIVPGDDDATAVQGHFQDAAKFVFGLRGGESE
jgi:hypothetical protein